MSTVITSPGSLREVETIQTKGAPQARAMKSPPSQTGIAPRLRPKGRSRRLIRRSGEGWAAISAMLELPDDPAVQHRDDEDQQEQQHGDGRSRTEEMAIDGGLIDIEDDRGGGARGPTIGHHVDLAEDPQGG